MPIPDAHKNFAFSTVATAPSPATSGTSLVLASGEGARFPQPSTDGAFNVVICPVGTQPSSANAEIARCTARSTDTLTITRTQEGTSARTVIVGDQVFLGPTSKWFSDIETGGFHSSLITPDTDPWFPTGIAGATVANMRRELAVANTGVLTSGKPYLVFMPVWPGLVINKITFFSGTVACVTPANQWFALYDVATLAQLAITADDTTTAWGASAQKTLTLASPYTVPLGIYAIYACEMVNAATVPSAMGISVSVSTAAQLAPQVSANATATGRTNPASAPNPVVLSAGFGIPYCIFS